MVARFAAKPTMCSYLYSSANQCAADFRQVVFKANLWPGLNYRYAPEGEYFM
jgi:hypothetical protein